MNKIIQIKAFNDILDQFIDYIHVKFPVFKSDIILTKTALGLLRKSNPRMVVENLMEYILPYSKYIEECNEDFFLNTNNITNIEKTSENLAFINRIKDIWVSDKISNHDKANIWLYFKKLLITGRKIV